MTAIAVKAAGSLLVRKFRAPVKEWIDGLRIDEHIGAFNAERASVNKTWATRDVSARNRSPDRPTNSKDAGAFTAKQAASPKKLARAVTRRLERVDKDLAAARVHRERTRLLQLGARGSHDPELVMQLAFEEREEGLADLDSARQLIDTIAPVKSNLNSELKNRLDVADREQETLRHDFDRRFLSNRFRDR
ncbi:hypothetical protein AB1286_03695 [Trinickia sp. NRRL B-1857]|uniref:hypothetical protein n=1 Tax=Trinickia sp. NRRL B-1857 TaxID=3162879 RepID=UPI003D2ADF48